VKALPPITARISSLKQGMKTSSPFSTGPSIIAMGSGAGLAPITFTWTDSMVGDLGSNSTSATLSSPLVGKHSLRLTVGDAHMRSVSDRVGFSVLATGQTQFVAPYPLVNTLIGMAPRVDVLSSVSTTVYLAVSPGRVYSFDDSQGASTASPTLVQTTASVIRDLFFDTSVGLAYVATANGYLVCDYSGGTTTNCNSFSGGQIPSNDTTAVLRVRSANSNDYLLVGTSNGLFVPEKADGETKGKASLNVQVTGLAARNLEAAWIATSDGLYTYDLSQSGNPIGGSPRRQIIDGNGPGNVLTDVALGSDGTVWVGSPAGLGRFVPSTNTWTTWRAAAASDPAPSLASNDVRAVAVATAVNIAGVARDIVWIATAAGVSRFDPSIPSFATFTTADGLPSDSVRSVIVLANGHKVFGTDSGVAVYTGL
jgi:ligand-binding sensor domain-containing protein